MLFNSITQKKYLCWPNILQAKIRTHQQEIRFNRMSNAWHCHTVFSSLMRQQRSLFTCQIAERDNAKQFSLSCLDSCLGELVIWCFIQGPLIFYAIRYIYAPLHNHPVGVSVEWWVEWMKNCVDNRPKYGLDVTITRLLLFPTDLHLQYIHFTRLHSKYVH